MSDGLSSSVVARDALELTDLSLARAYAAIVVVIMHLMLVYNSDFLSTTSAQIFMIGRGDVAVGAFFTLSGFVLTNKWMSDLSMKSMILERMVRLLVPFIASYFFVYLVFKIGAGPYGIFASSLGFKWGLVAPIGMLENMSLLDTWFSFKNQIIGINDNVILTAWTLYHELRAVFILILIIWLLRKIKPVWTKPIVRFVCFVLIWIATVIIVNDGYGLLAAFSLGSSVAVLRGVSRNKTPIKIRAKYLFLWVNCSVFCIAVVMLSGNIDVGVLIDIGLAAEEAVWYDILLFMLIDGKYFLFGLFSLSVLPLFSLLSKSAAVKRVLLPISNMSYSIYLIHSPLLMLHTYLLFRFYEMFNAFLQSSPDGLRALNYVTPTVEVAVLSYFVLLAMSVPVFYFVVEKPSWRLSKIIENRLA